MQFVRNASGPMWLEYSTTTLLTANMSSSSSSSSSSQKPHLFTHLRALRPYTTFAFKVIACNSIGCTSSPLDTNTSSSVALVETLADSPGPLEPADVTALSSYSIEIRWRAPRAPNGRLTHYLLERVDHTAPLRRATRAGGAGGNTNLSVVYRLEASDQEEEEEPPTPLRLVDYEGIEACGVYSYRLWCFNTVGNSSSRSVATVTAQAARPLVVATPLVTLIDSYSARFEWTKPLTHCRIRAYRLLFEPYRAPRFASFAHDVDAASAAAQSTLVRRLAPFTTYGVTLEACVHLVRREEETEANAACTQSLTRTFKTPGTVPQGIGAPLARLVSPALISVEWLEAAFPNGDTMNYQLLRTVSGISKNRNGAAARWNETETVYFGRETYFLDSALVWPKEESKTAEKEKEEQEATYVAYKVVYSNEFGHSVSGLSNHIYPTVCIFLRNSNYMTKVVYRIITVVP